MKIDLGSLAARLPLPAAPASDTAAVRARPSLFRYDYLTLAALQRDVCALLDAIPRPPQRLLALDLGSDSSPYQSEVESRGYALRTLDLVPGSGADYFGTAERTGLADESFDLVLCTQVLEHCLEPWKAVAEIRRILRPGGYLLASAPHVWFFHPHPTDHWRFTQQGLVRLCESAGLRVETLLAQGGSMLAAAQVANFLAFGVFGRAGGPLYAAANVGGQILDRLIRNDLFCINFACLARKPAAG